MCCGDDDRDYCESCFSAYRQVTVDLAAEVRRHLRHSDPDCECIRCRSLLALSRFERERIQTQAMYAVREYVDPGRCVECKARQAEEWVLVEEADGEPTEERRGYCRECFGGRDFEVTVIEEGEGMDEPSFYWGKVAA
jgi:hypothetical protein